MSMVESVLDFMIMVFAESMTDASRYSNGNWSTLVAGGGFQHGQHFATDASAPSGSLLGNVYVSILQQLGIETDSFSNASGRVADWS